MKTFKCLNSLGVMIMLFVLLTQAHAGIKEAGGGDICEDRIRSIRDDIDSWINRGGPKDLLLPTSITGAQYSRAMQLQLKNAHIRCVSPGDPAYPVQVNGFAKTCRFDKSTSESTITCDMSKFQSQSEPDQYVLIHHEYAGLADIELPQGEDSDYRISNQISSYLSYQTVIKLAVKGGNGLPGAGNWKKIVNAEAAPVINPLISLLKKTQFSDCEIKDRFPWADPGRRSDECEGADVHWAAIDINSKSKSDKDWWSLNNLDIGLGACVDKYYDKRRVDYMAIATTGPFAIKQYTQAADITTDSFYQDTIIYYLNETKTKITKFTITSDHVWESRTGLGEGQPILHEERRRVLDKTCHAAPQ